MIRTVRDSIFSHLRDQMMILFQEGRDELSGGVVGIGKKVERVKVKRIEEEGHFIEEGSRLPVREDEAFMDTTCERDGKNTLQGSH
jgi:hypothetical protein